MPLHGDIHISTRHRAHFKALGISPTTDFAVVRSAFRSKALSLHPDKSRDPQTVAAYREARQALEELQFLKEFPELNGGQEKMTDEEEAKEKLAEEEEERTSNRMEKKESEQGSYAFVVRKDVVDIQEWKEKRVFGTAFVMKSKRGGGQKEEEQKTEMKQPREQQQQQKKKKQYPTTKDRLNKTRAYTSANAAAANLHMYTNGGRYTYDDYFEMFGDAGWNLGEQTDRDEEDREQEEGKWRS